MLQFFLGSEPQNFGPQTNISLDIFFPLFLGIIILGVGAGILFIIRTVYQGQNRSNKAFRRVVLHILVPKERKSEGQGGQVGGEDRLEQIREEIGLTETLFSTIAGLKAQKGLKYWLTGRNDSFSFEIVVHGGQIHFYVDLPRQMKQFIEQQVHAQYPDAQVEEIMDYNIFFEHSTIVGGYLVATNQSVFPLRTYKSMDSDPLSAVLITLSKIHDENSTAAIQFVVRSAHKKWRAAGIRIVREVKKGKKFEEVAGKSLLSRALRSTGKATAEALQTGNQSQSTPEQYRLSEMEEQMLKGIEEKISKGGMDATIRVLSVSDNADRARMNLDNVINSFSQYNLYRFGNSFKAVIPRTQTPLIQDFIYRSFNERRQVLVNTEEMSSLWHLPLHSTEAPNIAWLKGRSAPPPVNLPKEGLQLGYVEYRGSRVDVRLQTHDRQRHLYIIGKSGSGKSVTVANLAIQDILTGHGVCVVDPHGDLVEAVLEHIPKHRADDVIIFEPSDLERPVGLNMLEPKTEEQRDFAVQEMISIFYKLFPPEMIGPMFEHQMRNVMLTLMADISNPGTVIDIPRMFTDDDYVKQYLVHLKDPVVRAFWEKEMAKTSDFHKSEMLGYLVSKVGRFVGNEMMRNIMGQQHSGFDFRDVMDNQKILLVNLSKGKTGEINAKLLGLIVVAKLQMAAMGRADMAEELRKDFYLYIDEFQNFVTDSISTILSEARKYRLDLIVAHQYMGQLTDDKGRSDIRDAVLGNVGTMMVGRIGPDDSEILAKEFAPVFGSYDLLNTPQYSFYVKELIDNQASKPFLMHAYPPQKGNPQLAAAMKQLSRLKYGRDRRIVESEIMERTKLDQPEMSGKTDPAQPTL
ncbi:MAG: hypothetical protein COU35_02910 [Candidatus Magasanikbacteria bacterium CG10_big_fil_rev_8_21_14_0_10_47_10]|uniref:DUF8128 domain-containing protein n=1 Tax=Candidatus Magasanikbacteria bacterium CG10_big_fil_rev_8_21_14_0_10_47_10 TaxID=1974652 RepID=A0A2H0TQG2_9BACT|nr:MAG: hypothetical protein COU35_02910 [Candidatus Magasanikbacteria bacterium CG10_big_fil_rev_8_21_14_0_10_47_10]